MSYEKPDNGMKLSPPQASTPEQRTARGILKRICRVVLESLTDINTSRTYPEGHHRWQFKVNGDYILSGAPEKRIKQIMLDLQTPEMIERCPDLATDEVLVREIACSRQALERMQSGRLLPTQGLSAEQLGAMGIRAEPIPMHEEAGQGRPYRVALLPEGWSWRFSEDPLQATHAEIVDELETPRLVVNNSVRITEHGFEVHQGVVDYAEPDNKYAEPDKYFGTGKL